MPNHINTTTLVLGAGLAGLSASYHIGHENCLILEKEAQCYGHAKSFVANGATWDEGPHVSFTKDAYVQDLLSESLKGRYLEFAPIISNWFEGLWISHPAQSNLYQVSEQLRSECVNGFIQSQQRAFGNQTSNYADWLVQSLGKPFTDAFARKYTRKYWTVEPEELTSEWVGDRVFRPNLSDVINGSKGPLPNSTHYIKSIRYPEQGGFESFFRKLSSDANILLSTQVVSIDLERREVLTEIGQTIGFQQLINTIPLPKFVKLCKQATKEMHQSVSRLACTELLLVNVIAPHPARRPENWIYVYDESMLSTRISITESLSPTNVVSGMTGIQVEVYGSRFRPLGQDRRQIARTVVGELARMGLIDEKSLSEMTVSTVFVPFANIVFTHETSNALNELWSAFEQFGLERELNDCKPLPVNNENSVGIGPLVFAGRFGQWKYSWSDDCILRGRQIARSKK